MIRTLPVLALIASVLVLVRPDAAWAVYPPAIKDDGKFFGKEALEKANKKIRDLYENYKKDVIIETIASLSEEQEKKFKADTPRKMFDQYANARGKELGLNGLYILISKKPQQMVTHADSSSQKVFTVARQEKVYATFREQFRAEKYDAGLLAALDEVEAVLKAGKK